MAVRICSDKFYRVESCASVYQWLASDHVKEVFGTVGNDFEGKKERFLKNRNEMP